MLHTVLDIYGCMGMHKKSAIPKPIIAYAPFLHADMYQCLNTLQILATIWNELEQIAQ